MRNSVWSPNFDASTDPVARRNVSGDGVSLSPGDTVPETAFSPRRLRQLFDQRTIVHRATYDALINGYARFVPVEEPVSDAGDETPVPVEEPVAQLPGLPGLPIPPTEEPEAENDDEAELEKLRADAKELGIEVDGRWKAKRLQSEIDKALENGKSS
jgi:hypothetical protein